MDFTVWMTFAIREIMVRLKENLLEGTEKHPENELLVEGWKRH